MGEKKKIINRKHRNKINEEDISNCIMLIKI